MHEVARIAILLAALGSGLFFGVRVEQELATRAETEGVRMIFVGDIMLSRAIGNIMIEREDYRFPFLKIGSTTENADIVFGNLENPLSLRGIKSGSIYSFRADPRVIQGLTFAEFNVVSIANNHLWDYGKAAFEDTLTYLLENGITPIGGGKNYSEAHAPKIIRVGKQGSRRLTRVAFLAYSNFLPRSLGLASSMPAVAQFDDDILKTDIAHAKELGDFVVVSFHWGDEYQTKHNAEQERIAKFAIDAGANLVIGHHPHVVQEVEEYKDGIIAYSLGNFIFDQNFSTDTGRGLLLEVILTNNKIASVTQRKVAFNNEYQPYLLE